MVITRTWLVVSLLVLASIGHAATNKSKGFPGIEGKVLVIQSGCEEAVVVNPTAFKDFKDDFPKFTVDGPEFRTAMHKAFWKGLLQPPVSNRIALDTTCFLTGDSSNVYDSATKTRYFLDTTRLEPGKVYLARTRLEFGKSSISIPSSLTPGRSPFAPDASEKVISAQMSYAVYDPESRKIVFADVNPSAASNTFAIVANIVTKSDWTKVSTWVARQIKERLLRLVE